MNVFMYSLPHAEGNECNLDVVINVPKCSVQMSSLKLLHTWLHSTSHIDSIE